MMILMDVTNRCNLRCVMCSQGNPAAPQPDERIELDAFEKIAAALFPRSCQVHLSCAHEPLTLPSFGDYLAIASRYAVPKLNLTTNAMLLTRPVIERIVASGLPWLAISVDGATPSTYESIRTGARFDRLLENLRMLAAVKREQGRETPAIQFNWVLMEQNLEEAPLFIELMAEFAPRKFVFSHLNYAPPPEAQRAKINGILKSALTECVRRKVLFEELPNFCLSLEEIARAYGCSARETPKLVPRCADPWHMMRIRPNGDACACAVMCEPVGNIRHSNPLDIWHGNAFTALRARIKKGDLPAVCRACPYAPAGLVQSYRVRARMDQLLTRRLATR